MVSIQSYSRATTMTKKTSTKLNRTWRPGLHHTSGQAPHAVVQQRDQQVIKLLPGNTGWPVCLKEKSPGEKIHEHPWTFEMDDDWGYPYIRKSPTQCFSILMDLNSCEIGWMKREIRWTSGEMRKHIWIVTHQQIAEKRHEAADEDSNLTRRDADSRFKRWYTLKLSKNHIANSSKAQ